MGISECLIWAGSLKYSRGWNKHKDNFIELAKSEDCQEVFSDEREWGLKPIENSFYEDSPNREVHKIENIVINGKNV